MNPETRSPRAKLIREAAVLQIKLLADGFRDAVLIPVSLFAALIGLLRGGDEPDREYRRVIKLGRRSERWINLFGHQRPLGKSSPYRLNGYRAGPDGIGSDGTLQKRTGPGKKSGQDPRGDQHAANHEAVGNRKDKIVPRGRENRPKGGTQKSQYSGLKKDWAILCGLRETSGCLCR